MTNQPIPTTVVNGFLGSGKTTIINHLIDSLIAKKQKVVYVKNEIGETDLDAAIMRGKNIISKELLNGCICCTLVGPFLASINELANTHQPDRIIIESAGSADPASLALMVENHPMLSRECVITVVDVVNFGGYEKIDHVVKRQTEFTDLIVFNKVELVDENRKRQVVGYVREINEKSPIIEAKNGHVSPELIFGWHGEQVDFPHHDHNENHHEEYDQIDAFTFKTTKDIPKAALEKLLENLPNNVFRVKGILKDKNEKWLINRVFKRSTWELFNQEIKESVLIFIGYNVNQVQNQIVKSLENI